MLSFYRAPVVPDIPPAVMLSVVGKISEDLVKNESQNHIYLL